MLYQPVPPLVRRWLAALLALLIGLGPLATPAYAALDAARRRAAEHQEPGQAEHRPDRRRFDVDALRLPARLRGHRLVLPQRIGRGQRRLRKHRRGQRFHLCRWRQVFVARIHLFAVRRALYQLRDRLRRCRPRRRLLRRRSADLFARHRPGPAARHRDLPRGTRGKLAQFAAALRVLADVAAVGAQQRAEPHVLQPAADLRPAGRCDGTSYDQMDARTRRTGPRCPPTRGPRLSSTST